MDLKEKVVNIKRRENSGAPISNRFDFQKDWAICKILELHKSPEDYLVTFEYHDDILVFDSCNNPNSISFFQVKTKKTRSWTIKSLLKRKEGKNEPLNSVLGKLYENAIKFEKDTESLNFVTNAQLKVKLKDDTNSLDKKIIHCNEIADKECNEIIEKLKDEHKLTKIDNFADITYFKLGELDINHHATITKGLLADFLDNNYPDICYKIAPLYKSIFDEIKRKSNYEFQVSSFEELKCHKSVSREDFDKYITTLKKNIVFKDVGDRIEARLNTENAPIAFIRRFGQFWDQLEIARMDYDNKPLSKVSLYIKQIISENEAFLPDTILECIDYIFEKFKSQNIEQYVFEDDYIKTIILAEMYEPKQF